MNIAKLSCIVKVSREGEVIDLGAFKMLENPNTVMVAKEWVSGYFFDYYALAEELINRQIIVNRRILEEERAASMVCEYIEYHLNEGGTWDGEYSLDDSGVTLSYTIEPDAVKTEDGYTFNRQTDGSYSDGDMSWPNFKTFRETCDVEWKPAPREDITDGNANN